MRLVRLLILLNAAIFYAQPNTEINDLLLKAENSLYNDPLQSIEICNYLVVNANSIINVAEANYILSKSYYVQGNYNEALNSLLNVTKTLDQLPSKTQINVQSFIALIFRELNLYELSNQYLESANVINNENKDSRISFKLESEKDINMALESLENGNPIEALTLLNKGKQNFINSKEKHSYQKLSSIYIDLARVHSQSLQLDSTNYYISNSLQFIKKEGENHYLEMISLTELGKLYFLQKEYKQASKKYLEALILAESLNNKPYQNGISENLASTFYALAEEEKFYTYRQRASLLNNELNIQENLIINTVYNFINEEQNLLYKSTNNKYNRYTTILGTLLAIIILTIIILKFWYRTKEKQYKSILKYTENIKKNSIKNPIKKKEMGKSLIIPEKTEQTLLTKLNKFESSTRCTNKDMSLARLASLMDTNTKYLSEVINKYKGKHFNVYINDLRIKYIIEKLKNKPQYLNYKVSYLAKESGFSSHSSFATVFKTTTGISPTIFINLLKKEIKNGDINTQETN